jgi:hypothetical protein
MQDLEFPGVFCNYVSFGNRTFKGGNSSLMVFLTVSWGKNQNMSEAAATWSEDVTSNGFRACALVAGRHLRDEFKDNLTVYWSALESDSIQNGAMTKTGTKHFGTWYTGSRCENVGHLVSVVKQMISIFFLNLFREKQYNNIV